MTKKEFSIIAMAIKTYYPNQNILPNQHALEIWYKELYDIPFEIAENCVRRWANTSKWAPTIADIREMYGELKMKKPLDWGEGWAQVIKSISNFGLYRETEALESMDEITRECVKRLGYYNICTSENIVADRANFREIYEQVAKRKKQNAQIPAQLIEMMNGILLEDKEGGTDVTE